MRKTFIRDKMTSEWNNKHEDANSPLHDTYLMLIRNFNHLGVVVPEKSLTKICLGEKNTVQIKESISIRTLILSYTIQQK